MANSAVFFKMIRAKRGHMFYPLYAVFKFTVKSHQIVEKEIVKEWDLRILSEAALARFGGSTAFDEYVADNGEPDGLDDIPYAEPTDARDPKKVLTSKRKLTKELKGQVE
jgi:hypothetical protein